MTVSELIDQLNEAVSSGHVAVDATVNLYREPRWGIEFALEGFAVAEDADHTADTLYLMEGDQPGAAPAIQPLYL